jgi:hypothetical protein
MGDARSYRVALVADRYVNPAPGQVDGLAVLTAAGWGVMQLPDDAYPAMVGQRLLAEVAEQVEEFSRHGYRFVLVGEREGLEEALGRVGVAVPDRIVPVSASELGEFLAAQPVPPALAAAGKAHREPEGNRLLQPPCYSRPGMSSRPVASVSTRQNVPVRSEASISADRVAVT